MKYYFDRYKKSDIIRNHLNMGASNPDGCTINVNSLYIEKDNKPWIGVMGEYHFSRDKRENWYRELSKMKAGGINIVSTYLFWIYHEEIEGQFDFADDLDVRFFLKQAKELGLYVVLRIGPWAHGECRNGGFPDWLLNKGFLLRDNNPDYMEKVRIFYEKIFEQVDGFFYDQGGNIIAIQFENELTDNAEHIAALKELALSIGFRAPIYTATGWNSAFGAKLPVDEVLPVFGGYVDAPWDESTDKLPASAHFTFDTRRNDAVIGSDLINPVSNDGWRLPYERYPFATCELGPGLQPTHHRRPIVTDWDAYVLSLMKLGCGNNLVGYYMYHGGTNRIGKLSTFQESKATGYPNDYTVLNYDFQAPLSEYGEARDKYGLLNLLHLFIADFGEVLAPMEHVWAEHFVNADNFKDLRYAMRTDGNSGFIFVNSYQRLYETSDITNAELVVGGKDSGLATEISFPSFDVKAGSAFFFPFNLDMDGSRLECATAQPVCRAEDTWYFMAIDGIAPIYRFAGHEDITAVVGADSGFEYKGRKIITLSLDEARYMRRLSGRIYMGHGLNLYEAERGQICQIEEAENPGFVVEACDKPFEPLYTEELKLNGKDKLTWKKLSVDGNKGFIEIEDKYDCAQIYADGKLIADNFYMGLGWRIPAGLLYGKECYLVISEYVENVYLEK